MVASDQHIAEVFARECFTHDANNPKFVGPKALVGKVHESRMCVADEHYVPTALAAHGLDNEVQLVGRYDRCNAATFGGTAYPPGKRPALKSLPACACGVLFGPMVSKKLYT